MSDYIDDINTSEFLYMESAYYTNSLSEDRTNVIAKLILNSINFNFDLAQSDGSDFRFALQPNGSYVLHMWIAHWDASGQQAVLFFKIPTVLASEIVDLYAFWGNSIATSVEDPDEIGFLFYEGFNSSPLNSSKWDGYITSSVGSYGYLFPSNNNFTTKGNPLSGKVSWIMEAGVYLASAGSWDLNDRSHGFEFRGTENNFYINIMHESRIEHNATQPGGGTYQNINGTYKGLEPASYQEHFITYYEPTDRIYQGLYNRDTYPDKVNQIVRKVEGDTRPTNVRLHGRQLSVGDDGAYPSYISWFVLRDFDTTTNTSIDASQLYVPYETVNHQTLDYREYGDDITSIVYQHVSSFGGNAYRLSDNMYDSDANIWISDENATSESYVELVTNFGWHDDITSTLYVHYDSNHVEYYNASKLSDSDTDYLDRDYWGCTTTSGWSAINFGERKTINALRVKAVSTDLDAAPKSILFMEAFQIQDFILIERMY